MKKEIAFILFLALGFLFGWLYRKLNFDKLKARINTAEGSLKEAEVRNIALREELQMSEGIAKDLRARLNNLRNEDQGRIETFLNEKFSDTEGVIELKNEIKLLREQNLKYQSEIAELKKMKTN
jgi:hypothetical protein